MKAGPQASHQLNPALNEGGMSGCRKKGRGNVWWGNVWGNMSRGKMCNIRNVRLTRDCREFGKENLFGTPKSSDIGRSLENVLGKFRECGPWFRRLLHHPARKRSGSILHHRTHVGQERKERGSILHPGHTRGRKGRRGGLFYTPGHTR